MNCSATLASLALLLLTGSAGGTTTAAFHDAVARMHYAAYTGDAGALQHRLDELQAYPAVDTAALQALQLAYGYWQLAQLQAAQSSGLLDGRMQVRAAARRCVDHARQAQQEQRQMPEAQALQALCQDFSRQHPGGGSAQCARSRTLDKALAQAPSNPQVNFIAALCRAAIDSEHAGEHLLAVVARFEAAPAARPGEADWGHAEALVLLGEHFLQQGQKVAARDALERALVLVPDYRKAQRLLQAAVAAAP